MGQVVGFYDDLRTRADAVPQSEEVIVDTPAPVEEPVGQPIEEPIVVAPSTPPVDEPVVVSAPTPIPEPQPIAAPTNVDTTSENVPEASTPNDGVDVANNDQAGNAADTTAVNPIVAPDVRVGDGCSVAGGKSAVTDPLMFAMLSVSLGVSCWRRRRKINEEPIKTSC